MGAQTDEQKKKKAANKARKDKKKVKRAALAALQAEVDAEDAEDADVILIDSIGDMALTAVDVPSLNFNKRSFIALMAENDASIGQNERAADGLADWLERTMSEHATS